MFESVDLPAPFSPSSAWTSPSAASKCTSSFATTPGNRFVIPRSSTAVGMEMRAGETVSSRPPRVALALRAPDDTLHQVVHGHEIAERRASSCLDAQLALLVVDRAAELVPLTADDLRPFGGDQLLRRRGDTRPVRSEQREAVLHAPVVAAGLPRAAHRFLDPPRVVRAPVVERT